jgi:DNA-binding transcriptional LysR family regulator
MNDRQLRYALTVWRERGFSRAAQRLNVSQPAVSEQVRLLEDELGFKLFRRTGRGVEASYAGRTFLEHSGRAIDGLLALSETARQLKGGPRGALALGFSSGIAPALAPASLAALQPMLARNRLEVITATTRRIHRFVMERRLDAGLVIEADPRTAPPELTVERLGSVEVALITPPRHKLARADTVDIEALREEPLILNEPDIGYGRFVGALFADHAIKPRIAAVSDDVETVKLMVRAGLGVAIVPATSAGNETALGQVALRALSPRAECQIALIRRNGPLASTAAAALKLLRAAARAAG